MWRWGRESAGRGGERVGRCRGGFILGVGTLAFGAGLLAASPAPAQFDSFLDNARESLERRLGKELDKQINPDDHAQPAPPQSQSPETVPKPAPQTRSEPAPASPGPSGDVARIQRSLNALGYDAGPVDGLMGSRTRAAIRAWQRDSGRTVTGRPTVAVERGLQAALDRRLAGTAPSANAPSTSGQPPAPAGSGQASGEPLVAGDAAPAAQAGTMAGTPVGPLADTRASGSHQSAGGTAPRGGVAGEFMRSSADRVVLLSAYRDIRGDIDPNARNIHDQSMLMRIAAGQIQDPSGWGSKIFEFLPLLSRSERKAALTSAIPDRTARVGGNDTSIYAYYETIDWNPPSSGLRALLNQFESRALQHVLSTRFWPAISERAVTLPLNLRIFCMVDRPEYTFHAETWSFGPVLRRAPCAGPSVTGVWGMRGVISLDAFDTEVEMPAQQAQALYETLETRKKGDPPNSDIMMVDARLERVQLDANPKARGMTLRFNEDDVRATAVHIYPGPDLAPLGLALARKDAPSAPAQTAAPATERPRSEPGAGGSSDELVEVRWKDMEASQRPIVFLACVKESELPERFNDPVRYATKKMERALALGVVGWVGEFREAYVGVTTRACLQDFLDALDAAGWDSSEFEVISVGTRSRAAVPNADPAPARAASRREDQEADARARAQQAAPSQTAASETAASAPLGNSNLVEISRKDIRDTRSGRLVIYACASREQVQAAYAHTDGPFNFWVPVSGFEVDDAARLIARTGRKNLLVTTQDCLQGVLDKMREIGAYPPQYNIRPATKENWF